MNYEVLREVKLDFIKNGYFLEALAYDKDDFIRLKVARRGVALERLVNDENYAVKEVAKCMLRKRGE